ncbi:addiction module protein [uncultured Thiodictyon sp.]|uniref:addiction module protein n=1 Tax=uncultured Thiodictyon sp. TaxID=1846217 RepID=UPI0025DFBC64|nr:addiction module protein [uncultured Thiodictyon sp.]
MNSRIHNLVERARRLAPAEQAALLSALHDMVAPPDPAWEAAWVNESLDRLAAYGRRELEAVDSDEAMAQLRKKHGLE